MLTIKKRKEQWIGQDARTSVSDQQMSHATPLYPVDRYLAKSSNKYEMVNINDENIWNSEPFLRPEDEIILRKLHEMLQSTAEDLKQLSGELKKFDEPKVQVKSLRTPLDEEFNEKVHIEEVVNAKFHGYKLVDRPIKVANKLNTKQIVDNKPHVPENPRKDNTGVNVPIARKPAIKRNLGISRTRIIQINSNKNEDIAKENKTSKSSVQYKQMSFKYSEPIPSEAPKKALNIQMMPNINIRSELKEQKVLHLDILPYTEDEKGSTQNSCNVAVIAMHHENPVKPKPTKAFYAHQAHISDYCSTQQHYIQQPVRKVSKMSTCESSESTTNMSSKKACIKSSTKVRKEIKRKTSPKYSARGEHVRGKSQINKETNTNRNIDEWKKKLSSVYGYPSSSRTIKLPYKSKQVVKKPKVETKTQIKETGLNNADYIPYSQLTLGGVKVSDIEKELGNPIDRQDIPLSPIINKILSSRETSYQNSPRKDTQNHSPKFLTTSDENMLEEVITKDEMLKKKTPKTRSPKYHNESKDKESENVSYADDFEDDKSNKSDHSETSKDRTQKNGSSFDEKDDTIIMSENDNSQQYIEHTTSNRNHTYTKVSNLSFKNSVDIFEYIHAVDKQDSATQSTTIHKISLKGTQTSPPNEEANVLPIHNDLWPTIDPGKQVEEMFKLEKDFIKKLIIEEYGDLLLKPSTSRENNAESEVRNLVSLQKNTQTSPARAKSMMTSPTKTKTRTTSPFPTAQVVDHQTSPVHQDTNEEQIQVTIERDAEDISVNLSSPRFNLRLPNSTREVFSNLGFRDNQPVRKTKKVMNTKRRPVSSSSTSLDALNSSSEISSLGEVRLPRPISDIIESMSECYSTSSSRVSIELDSIVSRIPPIRSEGELSVGQIRKKKTKRPSDGELSLSYLS